LIHQVANPGSQFKDTCGLKCTYAPLLGVSDEKGRLWRYKEIFLHFCSKYRVLSSTEVDAARDSLPNRHAEVPVGLFFSAKSQFRILGLKYLHLLFVVSCMVK
jgi:hypothetical protein